MGAPAAVCQSADGTIVPGQDCGLSPKTADAGFNDWKYLINFEPPDAVVSGLTQRFHSVVPVTAVTPVWHSIPYGLGPINLDFYPVYIHDTPTINGVKLDLPGVLSYIRKHIYDFMKLDGVTSGGPSTTAPLLGNPAYLEVDGISVDAYEQQDADLWLSDSPLGSVLHFHVGTRGVSANFLGNPDNLGVVCSEWVPDDHWMFTTIWTPRDLGHAVSGNRQFGIATRHPADQFDAPYAPIFSDPVSADTPYFYTRAADRCTTIVDGVLATTVFLGGHNCWLGLCKNVHAWIEANGGKASVPGCISDRHDWYDIARSYYTGKLPETPPVGGIRRGQL